MNQIALFIALAGVSLIVLGIMIQNPKTDQNPSQNLQKQSIKYQVLPNNNIILVDPTDEVVNHMRDNSDRDMTNQFENTSGKYENVCVNGKDRKKLTDQQKYEEFLSGPCSPLVLVPGIEASSLMVTITDCEALKNNHPAIFKGCGWSSCSGLYSPSQEYRLWISSPFDPMRMLELEKTATCFGDLLQFQKDNSKAQTEKYSSPSGFTVNWYGNTDQTRSDSKCGVNAIIYMGGSDIINKEMSCSTTGFVNLIKMVEEMGMVSGLTYQAIPYDWRKNLISGETQTTIPASIRSLYKTTGKQVVLLGHSYGTLQSLYSLNRKLSQAEKDDMLALYIAAAPPYMGAPQTLRAQLGGDSDYSKGLIFGYALGINFYSQGKLVTTVPGVFDLYPRDTFERFSATPWMSLIQKRIQYEAEPSTFSPENIPFDFLPRVSSMEGCGKYEARADGICRTGLQDWSQNMLVKTPKNTVYGQRFDLENIIQTQGMVGQDTISDFEESLQSGIDDMTNPGTKTVIFYGSFSLTDRSFQYNKNPDEVIKNNNNFYFPETTTKGRGDGTVLATSALVPGLKWAWEFKNQATPSAKPVRFIDYCSSAQPYANIYDGVDDQGYRSFSDIGYNGMTCQCKQGTAVPTDCQHSCFINDPNFVNFVADSILTKSKSLLLEEPNNQSFSRLSAEQIKIQVAECPNLKI